ncbi:hypothetical protein T08_13315 [Trichinella sp. T8]|nr:hypothetical protein T08_13315 [Trichinella sp. T8]
MLSTISNYYKIEEQNSGNGHGVTSVIFRHGVHIFCHMKTCYRQFCQSTAMRNKTGNAQSANCLPINKSKHGILEVPEETDYSGITSITILRSRRRDRQEKTNWLPSKEKILTGSHAKPYIGRGGSRSGEEEHRLGEDKRRQDSYVGGGNKDKLYIKQRLKQFQDLDLPPG